ncbi:hypothetical protein BXZ70DRAFT_11423 [Cristinia sonorae]|uniref:Secreted protein n=1 Tax=Cristinia sonorae TaxID=1940300 RepID=A0A8K0V188_9AGAR|nr:hypothetical protein BXZ70DRAFT_11423 [Cristinia sonorae]
MILVLLLVLPSSAGITRSQIVTSVNKNERDHIESSSPNLSFIRPRSFLSPRRTRHSNWRALVRTLIRTALINNLFYLHYLDRVASRGRWRDIAVHATVHPVPCCSEDIEITR